MNAFLHHFLHLLGDSLPLFVLGAAIGAAIEVWLPRSWVEHWLSGGQRSVALAATAGALLPGCAMSTMPIAASLHKRGAPLGTVAAFIMIAPVLSPHTVVLTATLVSMPMAVARVVLSLIVAWMLGVALNAAQQRGWLKFGVGLEPKTESSDCCDSKPKPKPSCCGGDDHCDSPEPARQPSGLKRWFIQLISSLRELLPFLLGGLAVAAVLLAYVPIERFQENLKGGWMAYAITALIAIPTYVCDGGEIPLTRALLALGVGVGPAFCFMIAAVGTCLPTIAMASRIIGWRSTIIYLFAWLLLAVGGGMLLSFYTNYATALL